MLITKPKPFYSFEKNGATQTFLLEFLACRRRADLAYRQGWSSISTSNAMNFGSLFHGCLENIYRAFRLGLKLEAINLDKTIDRILKEHKTSIQKDRIWGVQDEEDHVLNEAYLKILLPAYFKKYYKRDSKLKWALIEDEFNNVIDGVRLRGKYDRVAVNDSNETWIYETKTKSRIDPEIQTRLSFDPQLMIYTLNYEVEYKVRPVGFVYDIICRPVLRKGKAETFKHFIDRVRGDVDDSYFMRIQQRLEPLEYREWKKEFAHMLHEFKEWIAGRLPTYRNPASCETRFGNCKFLKVCGLSDFSGLFKRKKVNPELS